VFQFEALRVATADSFGAVVGIAGANALVLLLIDIQHTLGASSRRSSLAFRGPLGYPAYQSEWCARWLADRNIPTPEERMLAVRKWYRRLSAVSAGQPRTRTDDVKMQPLDFESGDALRCGSAVGLGMRVNQTYLSEHRGRPSLVSAGRGRRTFHLQGPGYRRVARRAARSARY
jgi:hypothetical protein